MNVRILTVSDKVTEELTDTESIRERHGKIDLILSCGDLPPEFLSSLRHRYDVPLFYVLGNHDLRYRSSPPVGCRLIDREIVTLGGRTIVGFSGSRWYNGGKNQYTEKQMSRFLSRMRFSLWRSGRPNIVVTHAPPRNIGDAEDPCHRGFRCFGAFIEKYRPEHFVHGHIHRFFDTNEDRVTVVNQTQVINSYGFHIFEV